MTKATGGRFERCIPYKSIDFTLLGGIDMFGEGAYLVGKAPPTFPQLSSLQGFFGTCNA